MQVGYGYVLEVQFVYGAAPVQEALVVAQVEHVCLAVDNQQGQDGCPTCKG